MSSYAAVLRTPGAARAFGAALLGRLSYGTAPLALVLAVQRGSGSYAVAGTVMALFGISSVLLSPVRAALVDRHGPRRALPPMAVLYGALLVALACVCLLGGAGAALLAVLGTAAGACTPPLGPTMRTVWSELVPDRRMLERAYSLDGVCEELLYVSGPLVIGVLVQYADPAVGVLLGAGLVVVGTLALVASPALRTTGPGTGQDSGDAAPVRGRAPWRPALVAAGVGLALGAVDLLVLAFADDRGRASAAPWLLAALSVGSAVGGLVNGAVRWRRPARSRLALFAVGLAGALALAGAAPGLAALAGAMVLAGLFVAPALTTAYLYADELASPGTRTRAGAWVNTAVNAGSSAASAGVGLLVGRLPLPWCFVLAGLPALCCALAVRSSRGARADARRPASETPADRPEPRPTADR
ncbi:MFS transporter [Streptomyces sp. NBC_00083]|uniref:MFS transporter n=1 Tax=Streptomyces sp. NBC_00083 TaxID=2975647 RepID=UPI0022500B35|nr:MFS transporter [Streptomyces sp. NBC_00083]MCX5385727.1 MFS transporter [Streptomyces sp. NBC_00083]